MVGDRIGLLASRAEVKGDKGEPGNNDNMQNEGNEGEKDGGAHVTHGLCSLLNQFDGNLNALTKRNQDQKNDQAKEASDAGEGQPSIT